MVSIFLFVHYAFSAFMFHFFIETLNKLGYIMNIFLIVIFYVIYLPINNNLR